MGIKEELENLIQAERERLEARDQQHGSFHEIQRSRFAPLRAVLQELAEAVEPTYVRLRLHDSSALLELGDERGGHFRTALGCEFQPILKPPRPADQGASLFRDEPGFR